VTAHAYRVPVFVGHSDPIQTFGVRRIIWTRPKGPRDILRDIGRGIMVNRPSA